MPKLWLTYAWKDNQDQDVDHIVEELKKVGLEVAFDRVHIVPGQRLWLRLIEAYQMHGRTGGQYWRLQTALAASHAWKNWHTRWIERLERGAAIFPLSAFSPRRSIEL